MPFDYQRPTDWADAFELVAEPGAVAMMGGCDVLTRWRRRRLDAPVVVGLRRLPGVRDLRFDGARARIGAGVSLRQLQSAPEFARDWPAIANVLGIIGSPAIRSAATAVGNVAEAWPVSDLVPLLQVHDAELHIAGPASERRLPVVDYATTPRTGALEPGEL